MNCSGLTSITIPNSVTSIGGAAFRGCSGLTSIAVDKSNTIYDSCDNCNAIIETATNTLIQGCENTIIPNFVTNIENGAFYGCSGLTSITIPNSVTSIGPSAFYGCSGLTSINIPNSVTSIGSQAFYGCSGLTSITIGYKVSEIKYGAFAECNQITAVYCKASIPPTCTKDKNGSYEFFSDDVLQYYATLYVPKGCKSAYESTAPWSDFFIQEYEFSGVESTLTDDVNVSVENGNIVIDGADNVKVDVYSVNGQCVYNGNAATIPVTAKGLYIVKVNGKSFKVML